MEFWVKISFILCGISAVTSFSWSNCGAPTDPVKVISLDAYSNQTKMVYVTGRGKVAENMTGPIKGQVEMQKKFFWGWTKIPCMDQVGSCIYEDICKLSPYNNECPQDFVRNNLPCRCPVLEGQYAAKKFPIDLQFLPHWIEEGYYRIKLELTKDSEELLCVLMYIQF